MLIAIALIWYMAGDGTEGVWLLIGSFLPDIDHPRSPMRWLNPFKQRPGPFHRGKPHTIIGSGFISLLGLLHSQEAFFLIWMAALVHILADALHSLLTGGKFRLRIW